jgi:hypothetical protein
MPPAGMPEIMSDADDSTFSLLTALYGDLPELGKQTSPSLGDS